MAFVLTFGDQPLRFWCQRDRFGQCRAPKVKHPLRVFSEADKAVFLALALDHDLRTVARDNRDIFARPLAFLQHFHRGQLAPFDLLAERRALVQNRNPAGFHHLGAGQLILKHLCAVRKHYQRGFLALYVPILS